LSFPFLILLFHLILHKHRLCLILIKLFFIHSQIAFDQVNMIVIAINCDFD
jgi:hypothetical protein